MWVLFLRSGSCAVYAAITRQIHSTHFHVARQLSVKLALISSGRSKNRKKEAVKHYWEAQCTRSTSAHLSSFPSFLRPCSLASSPGKPLTETVTSRQRFARHSQLQEVFQRDLLLPLQPSLVSVLFLKHNIKNNR